MIGLVASRLVGTYGRPTILFHTTKDGMAKGSCRSIAAFNMFDALHASRDLLTSFGGHSVAAGLALPLHNVPLLKERLEQALLAAVTPEDLRQKMALDAEIRLTDVSTKFMKDMEYLQPFGNENAQPAFYVKNISLLQKPQLLKDAHVKCSVFADGVVKPVIFFNRPELFEQFMQQEQEQNMVDLAVQVTENHWNDKVSLELCGLDVAFHTKGIL